MVKFGKIMMRIALFKGATDFAVLPLGARELDIAELAMVTGGEDGCSPGDSGADGNCGAQGDTSSDGTMGTLPAITVTESATPIGAGEGEQLAQNIDLAFNNPVFAIALFGMTIFNFLANPGSGNPPMTMGNPMGDPNPMMDIPSGP